MGKALPRSTSPATAGADEYHHDSDAEAWLQHQIDKAFAAGRPHAIFVTIDPPLAAALLDRNPVKWNRTLSMMLVQRYGDALARGEWMLNGETVIVADSGELNNGQHRLNACILTGISFRTLIVFGIARDTRSSLDQGKRRSVIDELTMAGYTNVGQRVSAAATVLGVTQRKLQILAHGGATTAQILAFCEDHSKLMKGNAVATRLQRVYRISAGNFTGVHYLLSRRSRDAADLFFEQLIFPRSTVAIDPVNRLVTRLRDHATRRNRMERAESVCITLKAWNHWCRGEMCELLTWRAMGINEEIPIIDEWSDEKEALLRRALAP